MFAGNLRMGKTCSGDHESDPFNYIGELLPHNWKPA
jgi:hypothetical protein